MVRNVIYTCVLYNTKNGTRRVFYKNSKRINTERVPSKVYRQLKCYIIDQKGTRGIRHARVHVTKHVKHPISTETNLIQNMEKEVHNLFPKQNTIIHADKHNDTPMYEDTSPVFQIDNQRNIFKQLRLMNLPRALRNGLLRNGLADNDPRIPQFAQPSCTVTKQQVLDFLQFINYNAEQDEEARINKFAPTNAAGMSAQNNTRAQTDVQQLKTTCTEIIRHLPQKCVSKNWNVVSVLGRGAYGFVFLMQRHIPSMDEDNLAAMKIQVENPQFDFTTTTMEIDMQRAFAAEKLSPHILCVDNATIYDHNVTVIVMERIDFTLHDYLAQKELRTVDIKLIMSLILKLMLRLHNLGFTHGDMHDENIGFKFDKTTGQMRIMLIDLGMATTNKNYPAVDAEQLLRSIIISKYPRKIRDYFRFNLQWFLVNVAHSKYTLTGSTKRFAKIHEKYIKAEFFAYNRSIPLTTSD